MRLTNIHGLPKTLANAIERDPYSFGDARISITGLLRPPRITLLHKKHSPDIVSDVSENIYSLMGRALHKVLEDGGDEEHLTEERLFTEVRGWRISGQIDLQKLGGNKVAVTDYKNTSAYAVMTEKPEWSWQQNSYAFLLREAKGYEVTKLSICAIIRDWNRYKAKENADYPQAPVVMLALPLWSADEARAFVEERVRIHQSAIAGWDMGDEPPPCTDAERWMRPDTWAAWREGNKRPSRVFDNEEEAFAYISGKGHSFTVEPRPGEPIRCVNNFCQVAPWCRQYADWQKENT